MQYSQTSNFKTFSCFRSVLSTRGQYVLIFFVRPWESFAIPTECLFFCPVILKLIMYFDLIQIFEKCEVCVRCDINLIRINLFQKYSVLPIVKAGKDNFFLSDYVLRMKHFHYFDIIFRIYKGSFFLNYACLYPTRILTSNTDVLLAGTILE